MGSRYAQEMFSDSVRDAQKHAYGRSFERPAGQPAESLTEDEQAFISERDSFYMATVTSEGWPYVQHRGGAPGFLKVLDEHTIAFADLKGNRQLVSAGNIGRGPDKTRVMLIAIDYPRRERFKLLGHAIRYDAADRPDLVARVAPAKGEPGAKAVEAIVVIEVVAIDWNCPSYITPRFTVEQVETAVAPLKKRIAELEAQLKAMHE
jgi:predicted pyridoxine 5'-phosphate oxidase superfamily flavin-nucleotide-binding protein